MGTTTSSDSRDSVPDTRARAGEGCASSQINMAHEYSTGERVEKDMSYAMWWIKMAATQGNPQAMHYLGRGYAHGWYGLPRDEQKGAELVYVAACKGYRPAQSYVGYMCIHGMGMPKDDTEGLRWLHLAAERGEPWAMSHLGDFYTKNKPDYHIAVFWYTRAAIAGHEGAIGHLAKLNQVVHPPATVTPVTVTPVTVTPVTATPVITPTQYHEEMPCTELTRLLTVSGDSESYE